MKSMKGTRWIQIAALAAWTAAAPARADVTLPALFTDHMVVQRGLPVHVWGWAEPGETVTVEFRGERRDATADRLGRWSATLSPGEAGGPFTLRVAAANEIVLEDVQVGDVWMASGQSNMELPLSRAEGGAEEIAAAEHPWLRVLRVEKTISEHPLDDVKSDGWVVCSPETAAYFTAVGYFFARDLRTREDVAVGLIDTSWGGQPLAAYTSLAAIARDPGLMAVFAVRAAVADERANLMLRFEKEKRDWAVAAAAAEAAGKEPPRHPWTPDFASWEPSATFNAMVAPVTRLPIRGVIWYQGESDDSPERTATYGRLFRAMIEDWRRRWGADELPFLFVQLANWIPAPEKSWPEVREAQAEALALRGTGMAVAIDVGGPDELHPRDKQTVGRRLALAARAIAYGEDVEYRGPTFRQAVPEGSALRVWLDHADGLHTSDGGAPKGFEIAAEGGAWAAADARIDGAGVVLSSPEVDAPIAVRYAWADSPTVNLYNGAGLPAVPFRSE
jgi:sialate O-acetylesterase